MSNTIVPQPKTEQKPTTIVVDEISDDLLLYGAKVVILLPRQEDGEVSPAGAIQLAIQRLAEDPDLSCADVQGIIASASDLISALPRS